MKYYRLNNGDLQPLNGDQFEKLREANIILSGKVFTVVEPVNGEMSTILLNAHSVHSL